MITKQISDSIYKYELCRCVKDGQSEQVKDGLYQQFDCNNHLIEEGYYCLGKKVGIWKQYDEEGALFTELPYEDGKVKGIVKHYFDGELLKRIFVSEGIKEEECPFETYFEGEIVAQGRCIMYNDDYPHEEKEDEEQRFFHGVPEKK